MAKKKETSKKAVVKKEVETVTKAKAVKQTTGASVKRVEILRSLQGN
jgi:hypothetical protein